MKKYCVYAIGKKEDLQQPYNYCYIGVTNNPEYRWKFHKKSKYFVGKYIRKHLLTYEENMCILFEGDEDECFDLESKYRPIPFLGLNESVGGKGGYTSYTKERNEKISLAIKKVRKTKKWKTVRDMKGEKNPRAKKWKIISPDGNIFNIKGKLSQFCNEHFLLESCLRYHLNEKVPKVNLNGFGGYRPKSELSKKLRMNTIGWTLFDVLGGV